MLKKIKKYFEVQNTVSELARLSDRELSDLGIGRADIVTVARSTIYKK